jgi:hypothetical protein
MQIEALETAIERTLRLAEVANFEVACKNVKQVVDEYFTLKTAYLGQPTAAKIRSDLRSGQALFSRLERWIMAAEGNVVRDYVLSGKAKILQQLGQTESSNYKLKDEAARFRLWQSSIEESLLLLMSDRGQPENFPLKQLVRDLAKIWEQFSTSPFTNIKKGEQKPRDFVLAVCAAIEPDLKESQIETAIRSAVKITPGQRRGRKLHRAKRD